MLARALIVLLVVLNLGVAAWWATRGSPTVPREDAGALAGVPRLQLLRELPGKRPPMPAVRAPGAVAAASGPSEPDRAADPAAPAEAPPAAAAADAAAGSDAPASAATPAPATRLCHAAGPFADSAAARAARDRLAGSVSDLRLREVAAAPRRGWRVWIPPMADRDATLAMAERIGAAGIDDYLPVGAGDEANSIALGRYGSEESARRREAALHAAGFAEARAEPLGQATAATWIDFATAGALDAAARAALGGVRIQSRPCPEGTGPLPSARAR